jgi:hypothetical protein
MKKILIVILFGILVLFSMQAIAEIHEQKEYILAYEIYDNAYQLNEHNVSFSTSYYIYYPTEEVIQKIKKADKEYEDLGYTQIPKGYKTIEINKSSYVISAQNFFDISIGVVEKQINGVGEKYFIVAKTTDDFFRFASLDPLYKKGVPPEIKDALREKVEHKIQNNPQFNMEMAFLQSIEKSEDKLEKKSFVSILLEDAQLLNEDSESKDECHFCYTKISKGTNSNYVFTIIYVSDDWLFTKNVYLFVDGQKLSLPISASVNKVLSGGRVLESISIAATPQQFSRIGKAKEVFLRLSGKGHVDFKFPPQNIYNLKRFYEEYVAGRSSAKKTK